MLHKIYVVRNYLPKSALRSFMPYPLRSCTWNTSSEEIKDESRDRDCLPDPPTPTNSALPRGASRMRLILKIFKFLSGPIGDYEIVYKHDAGRVDMCRYGIFSSYINIITNLPANMLHGILKEHQIHSCNEIVICREGLIEQSLDVRPVVNGKVLRISNAFREMTVDHRLS